MAGAPDHRVRVGADLHWAGRQYYDREAISSDGARMSFIDVDRSSNRLAHALRAGLGLETNDRIAFLLENSPESLIAVQGATKAAVTAVSLNARHNLSDHMQIISDCEPRILVAGAAFQEAAEQIVEATGGAVQIVGVGWRPNDGVAYSDLLESASDGFPGLEVDPDLYMPRIAYTSGTTGQPKGVYYSYRSSQLRLRNFFQTLEYALGVTESMVHTAPLTHAAGNFIAPYFLRGARAIVLPRFEPSLLARTIAEERASHIFLVPTMIRMLMSATAARGPELSSLKRLSYGAAPAPRALLEEGLEHFGPILRQHYGMTEAPQPLCILYPHEHEARDASGRRFLLESCGRPISAVDVICCDDTGAEVATGEIGEIVVNARGAGASGFWNRPELEAEYFSDGWLRTGDLGQVDERGYLRVVGRKKEMIISGGFNVYSAEVENVLTDHPGVAEAAVFGQTDELWGEVVCAWIVPKSPSADLTEAAIHAFCSDRLSGYKKPRIVRIVEKLPRNAAGKVDRRRLTELAQAGARGN